MARARSLPAVARLCQHQLLGLEASCGLSARGAGDCPGGREDVKTTLCRRRDETKAVQPWQIRSCQTELPERTLHF